MTDNIVVEFIPASHWWQRAKWKLVEEYTSANGEVTVPAKFISDGASIPWALRIFFSSTGAYFGAAIVHDFVLVTSGDWHNANRQFRVELNALGINTWRKRALITAVKSYSWFVKHLFK